MSATITKITYEKSQSVCYDMWALLSSNTNLDWISQQEENGDIFYIGQRPKNAEEIIREEIKNQNLEINEQDIQFLLTCEEEEDYIIQS